MRSYQVFWSVGWLVGWLVGRLVGWWVCRNAGLTQGLLCPLKMLQSSHISLGRRHIWDLSGSYLVHIWDIYGTYLGHIWYISGKRMEYIWDISDTYVGQI